MGRAADGRLRVATAPGALPEGLDDLSIAYKTDVEAVAMSQSDLEALVERVTTQGSSELELARVAESDELDADTRDLANQPPVIRYVNLLVRDAYDAHASDV